MTDADLYERLVDEIAAGRVVVVAGTGVSVAASGNPEIEGFRVATWGGLIQHGIAFSLEQELIGARRGRQLVDLVKSNETEKMIDAAEEVDRALRSDVDAPDLYAQWFRESVGRLRVVGEGAAIPRALADLGGILATLNYDGLISEATGRTAVARRDLLQVQEAMRDRAGEMVLHLHGYYKKPETVVLGQRSYTDVIKDDQTQAVMRLFLLSRTLLFVGCGATLEDPNFLQLEEWSEIAMARDSAPHFFLHRDGEAPKHVPHWLKALSYGPAYDDLLPYLKKLAGEADVSRAGRSVPVFSTVPSGMAGYAQWVRRRYGHLRLDAMDARAYDTPLLLTQVFVEPSVRECAEFLPTVFELPQEVRWRLRMHRETEGSDDGNPGDTGKEPDMDEEVRDAYRRAYREQIAVPAFEALKERSSRKVVVLGAPGAGKSSLLQYWALW